MTVEALLPLDGGRRVIYANDVLVTILHHFRMQQRCAHPQLHTQLTYQTNMSWTQFQGVEG